MRNRIQASLVASVLIAMPLPIAAMAQQACPEGVAANGKCVDPAMAMPARDAAIILSQPKISYTAYPILPAGDYLFRYPHQLNPNPQPPAPSISTTD